MTASDFAAPRAGDADRTTVRIAVILAVAGAYAAAWRWDLILVVISAPAAALVVWVHARLAELVDARRAAALAVTAPLGVSDGAAVERIVAADLAALSLGQADAIDGAINVAERAIADPWRRSLTCERLDLAKHVASSGFGPPRSARLVANRFVLIANGAALASTLISIQIWQHRLLLVPLALALAAFSITLHARRQSRQLRALLVREASTEPARGTVLVPDMAVVAAVAALTQGRPRVHRAAVRVVAATAGPERAVAARRMARSAVSGRRLSRLDRDLLTSVAIAVVLVAVVEAM